MWHCACDTLVSQVDHGTSEQNREQKTKSKQWPEVSFKSQTTNRKKTSEKDHFGLRQKRFLMAFQEGSGKL